MTPPPAVGAAAPVATDELKAFNMKLSRQMQAGERWLIGGRFGAPASLIPLIGGVALLATYGYRNATANSDSYLRPRPAGTGMLIGGIALTTIGLAGLGTSIYAAIHGGQLIRGARNKELMLSAGPRHASIGLRARF